MAWPDGPPANKVERGKSSGESRAQTNSDHNHRLLRAAKKLVRSTIQQHESKLRARPCQNHKQRGMARFRVAVFDSRCLFPVECLARLRLTVL